MTQQQDLSAEAVTTPIEMTGRWYTLARLISQIVHPMITTTLCFLIIGLYAISNWQLGLAWAVFIILIEIAPPTTFFLIRLRQGAYSDEEVSVRHQRNELYFFTFVTSVLSIIFLVLIQAPFPFIALLCSGSLLNIANWGVNLFWKISVHASTAAMCATIAMLYSQSLGVLLWGSVLAVGWSRVRTRNHTPLQVLAGISLATLITFTVFSLSGLV
jgi:membrane-associated phospholipid phosphatase